MVGEFGFTSRVSASYVPLSLLVLQVPRISMTLQTKVCV